MWAVVGESPRTGIPVKVQFGEDGLVTDEDTRRVLEEYAATWGVVGVTPVGPMLLADLADESAAFLVATTALLRAELVAGDVPPLPDVPDLPPNAAQ